MYKLRPDYRHHTTANHILLFVETTNLSFDSSSARRNHELSKEGFIMNHNSWSGEIFLQHHNVNDDFA